MFNYLSRRQNQRGSILILVLIVTAILTAVAFSLAYRCQIEIKLAGSSSRQTQLRHLAFGGIQRCLAVLSQQKLEPKITLSVSNFFSSAQQEGFFSTIDTYSEDEQMLFYWITDEYGYISINHSDTHSWELTGLLDSTQVNSIRDWIDTDDDTRSDGAESDYYERIDPPTTCKNAPILSLKELLNVKGITSSQYSDPFSTALFGLPNNVELAVLQDTIRQESSQSLLNYFSAVGNGKININTASFDVLSILPGLDESTANTLLTYRAGADRVPGTEDDGCIEDASGIAKIEGLSELEVELLGQYCCFDSDTFRVFSCAKDKQRLILLTATVKIIEDKPRIISVERLI